MLTDAATPTFTLTAAEWAADASELALIQSPYNLAISDATAADLSALSQDAHVVSVAVVDTAADVTGSALDQLAAFPNASVSISDNGLSTDGYVRLSIAELLADASALSHLGFANGSTKTLEIYDTAADIAAAFDTLSADPQIGKIVVSNNAPVAISLAQHAIDQAAEQILINADGVAASLTLSDATVTGTATEGGAVSTLDALAGANSATGLAVVDLPTAGALPPGVSYDAATQSFCLDPSVAADPALAPGQTASISVEYGVSNSDFTLFSIVSWTVTGVEETPVLAPDGGVHPTVPLTLSASGPLMDVANATLSFTDGDLGATHSVSYAAPTLVLSGAGPVAPQALVDALSTALTLAMTNAAGSSAGTVTASFEVADGLAELLAPGQTPTATYLISLSDNGGGSSQQAVSFELTPGEGPFGASLSGAPNSTVTTEGADGFQLIAQYDAAGKLSVARGFYADGASDEFAYAAGVLTEEVQTHADKSKDIYGFNVVGESYAASHAVYLADGALDNVDYSGVTGQAYSSYDVTYGANGKPASASYSTRTTATWTYQPDGSYQVAYSGVTGQSFTVLQDGYNSSGQLATSLTTNTDGGYTLVGYENGLTLDANAGPEILKGGDDQTFVFSPPFGHDTLGDFASTLSGASPDILSLPSAPFDGSFSQLLMDTAFTQAGATITVDPTDTLYVPGLTKSLMLASQQQFVFHS